MRDWYVLLRRRRWMLRSFFANTAMPWATRTAGWPITGPFSTVTHSFRGLYLGLGRPGADASGGRARGSGLWLRRRLRRCSQRSKLLSKRLGRPGSSPHPALWEHLALASPLQLDGFDARRGVRLRSQRDFTDTRGLVLRWALERDGLPVQRGRLSAPLLAPGQKGLLAVPLKALPPSPGSELCLRVRVEQGQGTEAVPKGWVFREASFPLAKGPKLRLSRVPRRSWEDGPRGPTLVLEDGLTARFDGVTGALKSLGRGEGAPGCRRSPPRCGAPHGQRRHPPRQRSPRAPSPVARAGAGCPRHAARGRGVAR